MSTAIRIKAKGPIFAGRSGAVVGNATRQAVKELAQLGEERLALTLRPRPGGVYLSASEAGKGKASTGNYRRNLRTRVSATTARIDDGGIVYGPWLEGVGSRNAVTRFKGYAMWRRTRQWMERKKTQVMNAHLQKALGQLGK